MGLLEGKKAVVFGIANEKSIAWAIAQAFRREGADLAITYANETLAKRVIPLAESIGASLILPCDVRNDDDIAAVFARIERSWGRLDTLVHSVAFANKDELKGSFLNTTREGFSLAMDISAYSLIALAKGAHPLLKERQGSIITLSYYGGQKVFPSYNVMGVAKAALEMSVRYLAEAVGPDGIRVNAISAGPLKTLAAAGVGGFNQIAGHVAEKAPLRRNISQEEVAGAALYLASDLSSGVTGEVHFVDSGYNIIGL
ncbi:enoyl-ACP reductase [Geobacter sulfurreducens]|jgi:enoyl-[acyl-carrier protein] reductase I|uniref:Enoyl-[acyl-carrier-protein] reductase [NADH] n=1 Tax=Geobacter sulfurreducens (strain ATCC 51573 / DSM 12127 / PCA) TaxID=243231 RepID=Q74EF4_GEOSL|nr:enoyl-ACP reductase [Geobacter sulfurreducens]AAR34335.1 enoyl-(acyl carrier protein) reductase [Geobacter sulfurreducens PCA]AJY70739.1 enoyl-ACP reductase [Geobacter sulfurreducens]QVW36250.1 enoyl-ACP reductase [Geobacter sulfurreducens]UAC05060.1 enoyl-ACP reductase [Geobacter sulfurreducens]HBB69087.1 enoyl-ACP reductase [Geobacter sulfurreducens]